MKHSVLAWVSNFPYLKGNIYERLKRMSKKNWLLNQFAFRTNVHTTSRGFPNTPDNCLLTCSFEESLIIWKSRSFSFCLPSFQCFSASNHQQERSSQFVVVIWTPPLAGSLQFSVEVQFLRGGGVMVFAVHSILTAWTYGPSFIRDNPTLHFGTAALCQ